MLLQSPPSWTIKESAVTSEKLFWGRRQFLSAAAGGALLPLGTAGRAWAAQDDPSSSLYPVERNPAYTLERPLTDEKLVTSYNNYYEFGSSKSIWKAAQKIGLRPWEVHIKGMVAKPQTIGIDDLLARMPLEERLYRHRCVEAWSMTVPWSGFPLSALLKAFEPLAAARYVVMETFMNPKVAPGQKASWYPWPYVEGLTLKEASNDLAFIVTGAYGKPLPKQNGAPLRLAVPWKYGFKSIKGIVSFTFTDERPQTFWQLIQPKEYGFWANVNPEVPHPRWSQATEKPLGERERIPTLPYNGYAEQVASLYQDMKGEQLFR